VTYPQAHDSAHEIGLLTSVCVLTKETARTSFCRADPSLSNNALQERYMPLSHTTPGIYPAQATPQIDGISARDDFLRKEAERGSRELLAAMIRELESMGVLA
jgi:hypothetical protein